MKYLLCLPFLLLYVHSAYAQTSSWTSYYADAQVKIEQMMVDDNRPEDGINNKVYQLRYTNLTQQNIRVRFNRVTWYGSKCYGCAANGDEYTYQVDLAPEEVLTATPGKRDKRYYVFHSRPGGASTLSKFELQNLTVEAR